MQPQAAPETGRLSFSDLPGWADDDLDATLAALRLGDAAVPSRDARAWFEATFRPGPELAGHFTGYYEPELQASRTRSEAYPCPIHTLPDGGITAPRATIAPLLAGYELAWLRDPVDLFFLQVQGSGRLRLTDGSTMRVGYAGKNGQPYVSIGKLLVERGVFDADMTAEGLKTWLRADPARGDALMNENPSYVMFRSVELSTETGPMGTLCPVTALRSLAVDPDHTPLGTLVWIEVAGHARLCIAQDTGSAIKGAGRADLFFGTGAEAGSRAGALNQSGRFVPLVRR
ncbi:membrane-bound lytic murein transglycosylase A [Jannaschia faecimaris]|uniref:peptidoglycan lytic exotransglycosylase n=1 Tax=Jannaschia faecimaris TaxID=1244108 RepID=A0A1H3JJ15_9RHOB|nr:MltA domain-containing protein [Jannaschia faecimaris]SDY39505.1 membrane-bound lytic murein transglycosylase A [Jannaschia faecimaris]